MREFLVLVVSIGLWGLMSILFLFEKTARDLFSVVGYLVVLISMLAGIESENK